MSWLVRLAVQLGDLGTILAGDDPIYNIWEGAHWHGFFPSPKTQVHQFVVQVYTYKNA